MRIEAAALLAVIAIVSVVGCALGSPTYEKLDTDGLPLEDWATQLAPPGTPVEDAIAAFTAEGFEYTKTKDGRYVVHRKCQDSLFVSYAYSVTLRVEDGKIAKTEARVDGLGP